MLFLELKNNSQTPHQFLPKHCSTCTTISCWISLQCFSKWTKINKFCWSTLPLINPTAAQDIWRELQEYFKNSTTSKDKIEQYQHCCSTTRINSRKWKENTHSYILHFQQQAYNCNKLAPTHFTLDEKMQCLQQAVQPLTEYFATKVTFKMLFKALKKSFPMTTTSPFCPPLRKPTLWIIKNRIPILCIASPIIFMPTTLMLSTCTQTNHFLRLSTVAMMTNSCLTVSIIVQSTCTILRTHKHEQNQWETHIYQQGMWHACCPNWPTTATQPDSLGQLHGSCNWQTNCCH